MYCMYCGAPTGIAGQKFCMRCGAPVMGAKKKRSAGDVIVSLLKCLCYYLLFFIISNIAQMIYMFWAMDKTAREGLSVFGDGYLSYSEEFWGVYSSNSALSMIIGYVVLIAVLFIFFAVRKKKPHDEIGFKSFQLSAAPGVLLFGATLQVFTTVSISLISVLLPYINESGQSTDEMYNAMFGESNLMMFLFIAVATPIVEEVIFRGLIYTRMKKAMPLPVALILSSLAFGAAHGEPVQIAYAAALGVVLALLYEKYQSIWPSILLHAGFNGFSFVYDYLDESNLLLFGMYFTAIGLSLVLIAYFFMSEPVYRKETKLNEAL